MPSLSLIAISSPSRTLRSESRRHPLFFLRCQTLFRWCQALAVLAVFVGGFLASPSAARFTDSGASLVVAAPDEVSHDHLGWAISAADFDGDGHDDLAMGARQADVDGRVNAGRVYVAFGSADGLRHGAADLLVMSQLDAAAATECSDLEHGAYFGNALAAGDFDGDGRDDLAVGLEGADVGVWQDLGAVAVFYGQADQTFVPGPCLVYGQGGLPGDPATDSFFGTALAVGDFDSDGLGDLVVGAAGATVGGHASAGTVTVVYAGDEGPLDPATGQLWHQDLPEIPGTAAADDEFGASLATGDLVLGLDVACDLAVGAPGDHLTEGNAWGSVQILFGCTESGLSGEGSYHRRSLDYPFPGAEVDQRFGASVAIGQFDCVGAHDLAVGAPNRSFLGPVGVTFMSYGDHSDREFLVEKAITLEGLGVLVDAGNLGTALTPAPRTDGCDDLAVSAPGAFDSVRAGVIYVLTSRFGIGFTEGFHSTYQRDDGLNTDRMGLSLAAGRFDGSNLSLAAGAPYDTPVGGDAIDGSVWILPEGVFFGDFEAGDLSAWSAAVGD